MFLVGEEFIDVVSLHSIHVIGRGQHKGDEDDDPNSEASNFNSKDVSDDEYYNPRFGLATKLKACKGVGQEGSSGVTFHAPGRVGECEGMNLHTPKWGV